MTLLYYILLGVIVQAFLFFIAIKAQGKLLPENKLNAESIMKIYNSVSSIETIEEYDYYHYFIEFNSKITDYEKSLLSKALNSKTKIKSGGNYAE